MVGSTASAEPEKVEAKPKKVSARKLLKRELEARYRLYTPQRWASLKFKERMDAEKSRELAAEAEGKILVSEEQTPEQVLATAEHEALHEEAQS